MANGAPDYAPWSGQKRTNATGGATIFEQSITIPKNTLSSIPASQTVTLERGFVVAGQIILPPGCAGLVGVSIFSGATQLYPGAASTWFSGDDQDIRFDTDFDVPSVGGVYTLTIKGYNDDDTYPHAPIVRFWLVRYPAP